MIDYLYENTFETDEKYFLMNRSYKSCITIEFIQAKELTLLKAIEAKNA